jgi:hypothetical protein
LAAKDAAAIWFLKGRGIIHGITAKKKLAALAAAATATNPDPRSYVTSRFIAVGARSAAADHGGLQ